MSTARTLGILAASMSTLVVLPLAGCETTIFDVEDFGGIRYDLALTGVPAEGSDGFRIDWQHQQHDAISGGETFNVIEPPEFNPRELDNIPVGRVRVSLTRLPANCALEDAEKVVTVELNATTPVTFTVACD